MSTENEGTQGTQVPAAPSAPGEAAVSRGPAPSPAAPDRDPAASAPPVPQDPPTAAGPASAALESDPGTVPSAAAPSAAAPTAPLPFTPAEPTARLPTASDAPPPDARPLPPGTFPPPSAPPAYTPAPAQAPAPPAQPTSTWASTQTPPPSTQTASPAPGTPGTPGAPTSTWASATSPGGSGGAAYGTGTSDAYGAGSVGAYGDGATGGTGGAGDVAAGAGAGGGSFWDTAYEKPKPGGRRGGLIAAVLVAALVAGGVGGGVGYWAAERGDGATDSTTVSAEGPADIKRPRTSVAGIANRALPSVVTIEAQSGNGEGGTGTGFVYDKQGHILTNNHVVASAANGGKLSATFSNGKKYTAEVVGRAQGYDVAVIKLKDAPQNLSPLTLGDSDKVAVGDSTIAIGAPFGLSNTVTTGIISAKDRPVTTSDSGDNSNASYMSALQTDASINPGNSGGPLLDARGAVIGINSAIKPSSDGGGITGGQGGSIGLGFAIPINQAKNVAKQLIKTGQPVYPVIGATVGLNEGGNGARITDQGVSGGDPVTPGGPADKAGLKPGDVITKLDDVIIDSGPTLIGEIWNHRPGDKVEITYKRDGKEHTTEVTLGSRKGDSTN